MDRLRPEVVSLVPGPSVPGPEGSGAGWYLEAPWPPASGAQPCPALAVQATDRLALFMDTWRTTVPPD